jgi:hypothetical protein
MEVAAAVAVAAAAVPGKPSDRRWRCLASSNAK